MDISFEETNRDLLHFISKSPSVFHVVRHIKAALLYAGFTEIREEDSWQIKRDGKYTRLNVEGYGGMIMSTWLDRPLSVVGRLFVKDNGQIISKLVSLDHPTLLIPSVAIHMDRTVNSGHAWNIQNDLLPTLPLHPVLSHRVLCQSGCFRQRHPARLQKACSFPALPA